MENRTTPPERNRLNDPLIRPESRTRKVCPLPPYEHREDVEICDCPRASCTLKRLPVIDDRLISEALADLDR